MDKAGGPTIFEEISDFDDNESNSVDMCSICVRYVFSYIPMNESNFNKLLENYDFR